MKILVPFVSIVGVLIGFLLGLIKDYLTNKPKLKVDFSAYQDSFNYFVIDELGQPSQTVNFFNADFLKVNLKLDVYNIGKSGTAIKQVGVVISSKGDYLYFKPSSFLVDGEVAKSLAFNVSGGCIKTIEISLHVLNQEDTSYLFEEEISFDPDDKQSLKFTVEMVDIYGKKYKKSMDAIAIHGAC